MKRNQTEHGESESNHGIETPENSKTTNVTSRCKTISREIHSEIIVKNRKTPKTPEKGPKMELRGELENFNSMRKLLTAEPCLARYATDGDNNLTINLSKTGFGITL